MSIGKGLGKPKQWRPCPPGECDPDGRIRAIGTVHDRYEQCRKCGKWLPVSTEQPRKEQP